MRESGGSSANVFYGNGVLFSCGAHLIQVGVGYDTITAPTGAIDLALEQKAAFGSSC